MITVKRILGIIIFIFFVYVLYYYFKQKIFDLEKIKYCFVHVKLAWIILSVFFSVTVFILKVFRWKLLLDKIKNVKYQNLAAALSISQLVSLVIPFRAGDVVQVFFLNSKENLRKTHILSSIASYLFVDFIAVCLAIFVLSSLIIVPLDQKLRYLAYSTGVAAIIAGLLYLRNKEYIQKIVSNYSKYFGEKVALLNEGLREYFKPLAVMEISSITLIMWLVSYFQVYSILKAFDISLSVVKIFMYIVLPMLVMWVSFFPGSSAILAAGSGAAILIIFGIEKNNALSVAFLSILLGSLQTIILGLAFVIKEGFRFKQIDNNISAIK